MDEKLYHQCHFLQTRCGSGASHGRNSKFFYRIYQLLKLLGIKSKIEMFYLVDETFRHHGEHITITFGIPIAYIAFGNSRTPVQWTKWVKQQVCLLVGITDVPL